MESSIYQQQQIDTSAKEVIYKDDSDDHLLLPNHPKYAATYDQVRVLLVQFQSLGADAKIFQFVELLRKIIQLNALSNTDPRYMSFQPLQSFFQQQTPKQARELMLIVQFVVGEALKVGEVFPKGQLKVLKSQLSKRVGYSGRECLVLVANQFLCLIPKSTNKKLPRTLTFLTLLTRDGDAPQKDGIKVRKLEFIFNYFREEWLQAQAQVQPPETYITFERLVQEYTVGIDFWQQNTQPMSKQIILDHQGKIEEHQEVTVIDFANEYIGGGVLRRGATQEEALFLCFPQAIVSLMVCEKMEDNEAIFIGNLRQYSTYTGFSQTLKFHSSVYSQNQRKDIVAIDALKFTQKNQDNQFKVDYVLRELNKALIGFTMIEGQKHRTLSTGKWGCGAFCGDPQLKYLIQWMAASVQQRPMIFHTFKDIDKLEKINEFSTRYINGLTVGEVFEYLVRYSKSFREFKLFEQIAKFMENDQEEQERLKRKEYQEKMQQ